MTSPSTIGRYLQSGWGRWSAIPDIVRPASRKATRSLTNGVNQSPHRSGSQTLHDVLFLVASYVMSDIAETLLRGTIVSIKACEVSYRTHLVDVRQRVRIVTDTLNNLVVILSASNSRTTALCTYGTREGRLHIPAFPDEVIGNGAASRTLALIRHRTEVSLAVLCVKR
jgi:hypothetical protein